MNVNDSLAKSMDDSSQLKNLIFHENNHLNKVATNSLIVKKDTSKMNEFIYIDKIKESSNNIIFKNSYTYEPWIKTLKINNLINNNNKTNTSVYSTSGTIVKIHDISEKEHIHLANRKVLLNDIILILILCSFIFLAWIKISLGKYLNQLIRALINYSEESKLFQEKNAIVNRLYIVLNSIFVISGGLLLFYIIQYSNNKIYFKNSYLVLFGCNGIIISIYIYKYVINKFFGFILYQKQVFKEYLHSTFMYFKALGMFILPLIFLIFIVPEKYKTWILAICFIIFFMFYFISVFRATRIMIRKGILLFYWILYLCTVEFLPIILLYKFLSNEL